MTNNKQQTAVDTLIINFKESITFLESSLDCCNDELTKVQLKARLSQARYFLNYAIEAKEIEKEQHADTWDKSMDNLDARGGNIVRAFVDFDEYYIETYGADHIVDANEMI